MTNQTTQLPLRKTALIAGIGLLIMVVAAPYAEMYVYPKLVVSDAAETVKNIIANKSLFVSCIMGYLITFIADIVAAWALYLFLKPVGESLSLLTSWFRIVYTLISLTALLNLVTVSRLLDNATYMNAFQPEQLSAQVKLFLYTFRTNWSFGLIFFGIHLVLLGYLAFKASYIPKIMGILLIVSGVGYLATSLKPFLFPSINIDFAVYTFYGELVFVLWLLIKGARMPEPS